MLRSLTALIGRDLHCRASVPAGRVAGFVIDGGAWVLRYAVVEHGGDAAPRRRLLPIAAFPPVAVGAGPVIACLGREELERGLVLAGSCEALSRRDEQALHDALHWAPYWAARDGRREPELHDASRAVGARLSCCGEPFGQVADLLVDTGDWSVAALRIATGDDPAGLHLPPSFIHEADWAAACFDSDVRTAALACAPTSAEPAPDADYFRRLLRHLSAGRAMT